MRDLAKTPFICRQGTGFRDDEWLRQCRAGVPGVTHGREQPDDVDEVPMPGRRIEAKVLLGRGRTAL